VLAAHRRSTDRDDITKQRVALSLADAIVSGGVPKDGIPSIDNPVFITADEARLGEDDVVFGVANNGTAKAYPQDILVHHEIVNDQINGNNVSVTYYPLTGTAMGFHRDNTTLGVSGKLVNSNLIIYDRATNSYFPQIMGEAISGERKGNQLDQFRVVWTTWKEWKQQHPTTKVLSDDTGFLRDYESDPYGSYAPRNGYYANNNVIFPTQHEDDRLDEKDVVYVFKTRQRINRCHPGPPAKRSCARNHTEHINVHLCPRRIPQHSTSLQHHR
jgi:hypothetical protein